MARNAFWNHRGFYLYAKEKLGWTKVIDFDKTPSEEVEDLFNEYEDLPAGNPRLNFRYEHPELDEWLLLVGKVSRPAREMIELTEADRRALDLERKLKEIEERVARVK